MTQIEVQRIVLGTDFTPSSGAAEDMAISLAKTHGARLYLVHVIEVVPFEEGEDPGIAGFYATLTREAEAKLDTISTRCSVEGVECQGRVEVGNRWLAIGTIAADVDAQLIVLGARKEPRDRAIATTGHKVYITADRPVLFVPERA